MTNPLSDHGERLGWRFPKVFWIANAAELFERAAFYGAFITLKVYLTRRVGFTDVQAGFVSGCFASVLYLLPTFMGAMADKIGFRRALIAAFALLSAGYGLLGAFQYKSTVLVSLAMIMCGGAIVKPVISGTVAKCSDDDHRARAFSIFYGVVNIGAFTGKAAAAPLRQHLGLEYINFYASGMALLALLCIAIFYRNVDTVGTGKSVREAWEGLIKVIKHFRFMCLILIVAGFWFIQGQLYATMTQYMLRLLGEASKPEWLANINPFVVVVLVVPITHMIRKFKPENAIALGLLIIPLSALAIALSSVVESHTGSSIRLVAGVVVHPITLMVIIGIALQGLAECFLSPKFLEYASKQAPSGEVGLYLGYQHLTTFVAWFFGFIASGYLLDAYCPDPNSLTPALQQQRLDAIANSTPLPEVYAHAHYIWFYFSAVGLVALIAMLIFKTVTRRIDRQRERQAGAA
ncbi:MAG: MFS transporter [Phycisphaerae bacterium]